MLRERGVAFVEGPALEGVRTPVTLAGERFTPRLRPRGGRPAQMDCQLAVALVQARPVFASVGISELEYSAAYRYRNRRRSNQLSAHAFGLAIDVHGMRSERGNHDVARNYERRWGRWQSAPPGPGWYRSCLGHPRTRAGRNTSGNWPAGCGSTRDSASSSRPTTIAITGIISTSRPGPTSPSA